jgi:unsaturated rhamnogalacturonyl hydrolase
MFTGCQEKLQHRNSSSIEKIPLNRLSSDYPVPYNIPSEQDIVHLLERILAYLDEATPMSMVDEVSGNKINDLGLAGENSVFAKGDFPLVSYEWGVTYTGMLQVGEVIGNVQFTDYTRQRLDYLRQLADIYAIKLEQDPHMNNPLHKMLQPHSLDDAGSMCAAMIKSSRAGVNVGLEPYINIAASYISNNEFRLDDGTLARQGPYPHTVWLDDLFMSVPALAQMGAFTGKFFYFDDAAKQVLQFAERMFNNEKGLFMHGWAQEMELHPEFYWARANGWAIMAIVELLEVLPKDHKDRVEIINLLQAHIAGLSAYQSGQGFWHQLLDRNDSYLETSATAIYTYSIARAINRGYVDSKVYGAQVLLAWNALTTRINDKGQVEGTCIGTGMAFDPNFYYTRSQSSLAAHGYGPVLLAGSEVIQILRSFEIRHLGGGVEVHSRKE